MNSKKFNSSVFLCIFVLLFSTRVSFAKSDEMKNIGELNGSQINLVTSPQPPERVGKGTVFWIVQEETNYSWATKYYASCDAKILSDSIDIALSFEEALADRRKEIFQKIAINNPSSRTGTVDFNEYESVENPIKYKIKSKIKDICAVARQEKRGEHIPFFSTIFGKDNTNLISAFLTGTFARKGDVVEG